MKKIIFLFYIAISYQIQAQELFVMTEPASNMPTGSIGVRTMHSFMFEKNGNLNYHLMPEIMWGATAKWMFHLQSFNSNSNTTKDLKKEGRSIYAKYRIYSIDDIHQHFRMALYTRISKNNTHIHQEEIETMGHNSGFEFGTIATKLINKVALSSSLSFEKALDNNPIHKFPTTQSNKAFNYTFSIGNLMYPKNYTSLKQTNINVMCEFLGQSLFYNKKSFLDIVPSLQFIIFSQGRVDLAWRKQLYSTLTRTAPNGFLVKLEYTFFNVQKK